MDEHQEHVNRRFGHAELFGLEAIAENRLLTACADCGEQATTEMGETRPVLCDSCAEKRVATLRQASARGFRVGL